MESKWFYYISHQIYLSFFPSKWLHSTKMWRTARIHRQCSHWGGGSFFKMYECVRWVWPSCTACRRTANIPGLAWQNESCSQPRHSNHLAKWKEYILADTIFKISIRHNNLGMRQLALASLMTNVFVHRVSRQIVALCSPNMSPTEHLRDITDRNNPHLHPPANQQELNEYSKS